MAQHYYDAYAANDQRAVVTDPIDKVYPSGMFFTWDTNIDDLTDTVTFPPHLFKYYDAAAVKSVFGSGLNWSHYRYADILLMRTEVYELTTVEFGTEMSHYRYADILLMRTEVYWALGQTAFDKGINEVRERAGLTPLTTVTLKDILSGRAWELVFENKMLWDQRRTRRCIVYGTNEISGIQNFGRAVPYVDAGCL